jgi:hypothetical protein
MILNKIPLKLRNLLNRLPHCLLALCAFLLAIAVSIPASASPEKAIYPAEITMPSELDELNAPAVDFEWNHIDKKASYKICIGTSLGGKDILVRKTGHQPFITVSNIPTNIDKIYVRLYTTINKKTVYQDFRYKINNSASAAEIVSPKNGTFLKHRSITFQWTVGYKNTEFWLSIGRKPGTRDIFHEQLRPNQPITIDDIPQEGGFIYARIWAKTDDQWNFKDYTYATLRNTRFDTNPSSPRLIISPKNKSILKELPIKFQLAQVSNASRYILNIGTTPGGSDLFHFSTKDDLSIIINDLDLGSDRIYAQLLVKANGRWIKDDLEYLTEKSNVDVAALTSPDLDDVLSTSAIFEWTPSQEDSQYRLSIGTAKGEKNIFYQEFDQAAHALVDGIPCEGNVVFVRLESKINDSWYYEDYIFNTKRLDLAPALMVLPPPGSTIKTSNVEFQWDRGDIFATYRIDIGSKKGAKDIFSEYLGSKNWINVQNIPENGNPIYVRLWSRIDDAWTHVDYKYHTKKQLAKF